MSKFFAFMNFKVDNIYNFKSIVKLKINTAW